MNSYRQEIDRGERFGFGANWQKFLTKLTEDKIRLAEESLKEGLGVHSMQGLSFVDAGCGSGLYSLAARRLGANVRSFDFDAESVACADSLKRRFFPNDLEWNIHHGSVLDQDFLTQLGQFDIVYSWGVLHHTGAMWQALENVCNIVKPGGKLFIAIYNDARRKSRYWWHIKSFYVKNPRFRALILFYAFLSTRSGWVVRGLLKGRPISFWLKYSDQHRGMSAWYDLVDWVGGFPYEYARPEEVIGFAVNLRFSLHFLTTMGGETGCNQFVFKKELISHE